MGDLSLREFLVTCSRFQATWKHGVVLNVGPPSTRSAKKSLPVLQIIGLCGSVVFCARSSVVSKAILCTYNAE